MRLRLLRSTRPSAFSCVLSKSQTASHLDAVTCENQVMMEILSNGRPLFVAIGPTASAELRASMDSEPMSHVDAIAIDGQPDTWSYGLCTLECELVQSRNVVVFLFDVRDEHWWRVLRHLAPLRKLECTLALLVIRAPRDRKPEDHRLLALSRELGVSVIAADGELVRTALVPLVSLWAPGLVCFHLDDLAAMLTPPSFARLAILDAALPDLAREKDAWGSCRALLSNPRISRIVLIMREEPNTALQTINATLAQAEGLAHPSASIMLTMAATGPAHMGDVAFLAIEAEVGA